MYHIARGVSDYFWDDAYERRQLEVTLLELFRSWGYYDVILPMFEHAETIRSHYSNSRRSEVYHFQDPEGSMLALRPDMTIGVARLVGMRLFDVISPQRFCYVGSVFRHDEPQAGRQREFYQAGIELIGSEAPDADAEVLALTVRALQASGLQKFRLLLGQPRFINGLLQSLSLSAAEEKTLTLTLQRKSEPALLEFVQDLSIAPKVKTVFENLLGLNGKDHKQILQLAKRNCLNAEMEMAVEDVQTLYDLLNAHGVDHLVDLDLTEIRNIGYYTGITFQAFSPGIGFGIAGGGRYDNLIGTFGPSKPAIGVALGVERILIARRAQTGQSGSATQIAPHFLVATHGSPVCHQLIEDWRKSGIRVAIDLNNLHGNALCQAAQSYGIPCALSWKDNGFYVYDSLNNPDSSSWFVKQEESRQLIQPIIDKLVTNR
ncbi:ATP phosphoribosyltransferase regulatory subunit [Chloroflexi bacterium TSY]|nr:ATP phosphoribosyltransferase regulatory subunit [Chloroflexi bacterium TSY]